MRHDQRNDPRDVGLGELDLRDQRRQRRRVADAGAEQQARRRSAARLVPPARIRMTASRRSARRELAQATRRRSAAGGISQPTRVRPGDRAAPSRSPSARPAACAPSTAPAARRDAAISPICANRPQRHRGRQRDELPVAPQQAARQGARPMRVAGDCRCADTFAVRRRPVFCGVREKPARRGTRSVTTMTAPIAAQPAGKPSERDRRDPERREHDAADAGAVVGHGRAAGRRR